MNRGGMGGITLIFTFLIFASLYRPVHGLKYLSRHKFHVCDSSKYIEIVLVLPLFPYYIKKVLGSV